MQAHIHFRNQTHTSATVNPSELDDFIDQLIDADMPSMVAIESVGRTVVFNLAEVTHITFS
jgi:hypothetical protein